VIFAKESQTASSTDRGTLYRGGAAPGRRGGAGQSGQGGQVVGGRRGEPRQRCEVRGGGCQSLCGQARAEAD